MTPDHWEHLQRLRSDLPLDALNRYVDELERWNRTIRLVGPRDRAGIALQVVDALLPFFHIPPRFPLLDIGSGAGLPGIPLALLHPDQPVICLEPRAKRVSFLRHACRQLDLRNVRVIPERTDRALREHPDLLGGMCTATARAVADISSLLDAARPFLGRDGTVILPRGGEDVCCVPTPWTCLRHFSYPAPKPLGSRSVHEFQAPR